MDPASGLWRLAWKTKLTFFESVEAGDCRGKKPVFLYRVGHVFFNLVAWHCLAIKLVEDVRFAWSDDPRNASSRSLAMNW